MHKSEAPMNELEIAEDSEELYLMANLEPDLTGLPFCVWISQAQTGALRHDIRVKVTRGIKLIGGQYDASVGIRPTVEVKAGTVKPGHLTLLRTWVELNRPMIVDYWEGTIGTGEMMRRLRKIR
jgi:hypothetical protein